MAIKLLDPKATFKVISESDDALVHETPEEYEALKTGKKDKNGDEIVNPTRFQKYIENFDEKELKFKEGMEPSRFHVRCLLSEEQATVNKKYFKFNHADRTIENIDREGMMLEYFEKCCIGVEMEPGKVQKVTKAELPLSILIEVGSIISIMTSIGKNAKKA